MNINTIWFRIALSIALPWILVTGFQAYMYYDGLIKTEETQKYDQSQYDVCSNDTVEFEKEHLSFRSATMEEIDSCRRNIDSAKANFESQRTIWDRLWNERSAFEQFFYRGFLPMSGLLLFVALWSKVKAGARYYVGWLKNGSTSAD